MSPALNFLKTNIFPPVIFCQAAAVHHAAGHVLAVARITLHHHGGWLEDRHGDLCHGQLLMVCLLCRDDWSIGGQHEVDAWVWHQVGLEPWLQSQIIQSSNHPDSKQIHQNYPKLEVTQQQGFMTRLYVFWTKKLSDVHVQCTVKASSEQVATSQVRLNFDVQNS